MYLNLIEFVVVFLFIVRRRYYLLQLFLYEYVLGYWGVSVKKKEIK